MDLASSLSTVPEAPGPAEAIEERSTLATVASHDQSIPFYGPFNDLVQHRMYSVREICMYYGLKCQTDGTKEGWRFRDRTRALFLNMSEEQKRFIRNNPRHNVLVHRMLPDSPLFLWWNLEMTPDLVRVLQKVIFKFIRAILRPLNSFN